MVVRDLPMRGCIRNGPPHRPEYCHTSGMCPTQNPVELFIEMYRMRCWCVIFGGHSAHLYDLCPRTAVVVAVQHSSLMLPTVPAGPLLPRVMDLCYPAPPKKQHNNRVGPILAVLGLQWDHSPNNKLVPRIDADPRASPTTSSEHRYEGEGEGVPQT